MNISSPAFAENAKIPKIYAKLGGNQRPPLAISDVPTDAKSLAIVCHDPDAPGRDGFYHWTVWNLPTETAEIASESLPAGAVEGITSWSKPGWGGPQPPFGTHRYQFYVYALDAVLDLPASTKPKELQSVIEPHIIEQAVLTGKFSVLDILRRDS
mgnify:CR=1 FL=1